MTADAPFLAALDRRPADDTARLVYADWLDEHDAPAKAAFLRLEVRWQRHPAGEPGWFALGRALLAAARATPDDWREQVSRPRLPGTTWRWHDPETEDDEEVEFHPGGTLTLRTPPSEAYPDDSCPGTWRQWGPRVELTVNGFSVHRGTAGRDHLPLRGRPIRRADLRWVWVLARVPGPDCIPAVG